MAQNVHTLADHLAGLLPQAGATESIDLLIRKAALLLETLDRGTLATITPPLTVAQYHALVALSRVPEQSLGSLATRLLCAKANASGLVDRLEMLGLVSRHRDMRDGRRVALSLTPAGRDLLDEALRARAEALLRALAPAGLDGLSSLVHELHRLIALLDRANAEVAQP
jgi:DNA-binding MarR family transcriptional regulator